jgi:hypothetical protein
MILVRWLRLIHKVARHLLLMLLVPIVFIDWIQETGRLNECLVGKHLFVDLLSAL